MGVVVGGAIGAGAIYALALLNLRLFGWPGADLRDPLMLTHRIASAPMTAQAMLIGGWFIGALAGGLFAVRIAAWRLAGWIVVLLVAGTGVFSVYGAPNPLWMQIAALAAPLFAGLVVSGASGAA